MAWHRPGDKPLSEPWKVYWCIYASPGLNELINNIPQNIEKQWEFGIFLSKFLVISVDSDMLVLLAARSSADKMMVNDVVDNKMGLVVES